MAGVDAVPAPAGPAGSPPHTAAVGHHGGRPGRPSILGVGVVVWLASELMFFSGLFATWFYLRGAADEWPPEGVHLDVPRTALATLVLVGSSATMHLGVVAAEKGDRRGLVRWLAITVVLGSLFLGNQLLEYAELDFSISDHAYGTAFFVLTGFHGLHVAGGVAFMVATLGLVAGRSRVPPAPPVSVCGYYWHFVDVVWVAMFTTIYLIS